MFLAVDIGNTQTTLGLYDDGQAGEPDKPKDKEQLLHQWRMATNHTDTVDELHARLYSYFRMLGLHLCDVCDVAIAGVVPILTQSWEHFIRDACHTDPLIISATRDCGIKIAMPYPTQIGADRIANAVAARDTYGSPVIVVDFGTATNIDVVDAWGCFRGGAIMPGLLLSASALFERAAKLSSVPLVVPPRALGNTTESAVQSGIVIGAAAQAEGIVSRIIEELRLEWTATHNTKSENEAEPAPSFTIVATGGLSSVIAKATELFDVIDPDLTIRGIRRIWLHRATKRALRMTTISAEP